MRVLCSPGRGGSAHLHSSFAINISSISWFLSFTPYINLRTVRVFLSSFACSIVIEHWGEVMETPTFSHLVKSMSDSRTYGWHLKSGQYWWLNLWRQHELRRYIIKSQLTVVHPLGIWNQMVFVEKPCISCQEKKQTHPPLWFDSSHDASGKVSSESRTLLPETLTSYLLFSTS